MHIAASFGAIGLILYSDPADYSLNSNVDVYPDSWWLPGTGVQRGTLYTGTDGDPLTPGYPSTGWLDYFVEINVRRLLELTHSE